MKAPEQDWLLRQLEGWEAEGLVTADSAKVLKERFKAQGTASAGTGALMMGIVGALLIGSGLIVLISHNWDAFSRFQRLACAFVPLLLSQVWTASLLRRGTVEVWKRESAGLLQTLTIGACIALVSQIYQIGGEWTQFLLIWCLLAVPLAWALRARYVAIFYALGIGVWALSQSRVNAPWHETPWMYPLLLLALWPYCPGFRLPQMPDLLFRRVLTFSVAAGIAACSTHASLNSGLPAPQVEGAAFWLMLLGASSLCLLPLSRTALTDSLNTKPQVVLPCVALLHYGFFATLVESSEPFTAAAVSGLSMHWGRLLLLVFAVLGGVAVRQRRFALLSLALIPLLPLIAALLPISLSTLSTLHLTAVGLTLIVLDFYGKPSSPRGGAAILTGLIVIRIFDSHFSLVAKGLVFMGAGIAFLAFNHFMSRRKQTLGAPAA